MIHRPRRLRKTEQLRGLVRETRLSENSLIYPLFLEAGEGLACPISSLEGQIRYSPDRVHEGIESMLQSGVNKVLLFGLPAKKDPLGLDAYDQNGIVQQGIRAIKARYPEVMVITDICMCEYTSHGHCGILCGEEVDNDQTLPFLVQIAVSHAEAGADMVAPSDMMDGRILAMRRGLDAAGFSAVPIMSYAVKYASSFYGPFREAAGSAPSFGNRRGYQMDYHNSREAMREAELDTAEGADILMVKPAMSYLDIVKELSQTSKLPIAAYSVSGEYAMIKAAAKAGLIDEHGVLCESAVAVFRAGADLLITYYAKEIAQAIRRGDIG